MAKMESLKITVDSEQFRADIKMMVDELVEQATASLDARIRAIVRHEMADPRGDRRLEDHLQVR